jgi:hypothetical protein
MDKPEKLATCTQDEEKQFHYTQTIKNNVNKTWALLQMIRGKDLSNNLKSSS